MWFPPVVFPIAGRKRPDVVKIGQRLWREANLSPSFDAFGAQIGPDIERLGRTGIVTFIDRSAQPPQLEFLLLRQP
jgi:hypothetical protein